MIDSKACNRHVNSPEKLDLFKTCREKLNKIAKLSERDVLSCRKLKKAFMTFLMTH